MGAGKDLEEKRDEMKLLHFIQAEGYVHRTLLRELGNAVHKVIQHYKKTYVHFTLDSFSRKVFSLYTLLLRMRWTTSKKTLKEINTDTQHTVHCVFLVTNCFHRNASMMYSQT